jgi:hypothetical protein
MIQIKHAKTNAITDWTQAQLDSIIAGNPPPLPPPGTTLSQVTLPSDWNDDHVIVGDIIGGALAATQVAFGSGANTIAGSDNLTWNNALTVKGASLGPTYTVADTSNVVMDDFGYGDGNWVAGGYGNAIRVLPYRVITGLGTVYATNYVQSPLYIDDNSSNLYAPLWQWDAVAGADGYIVFRYNTGPNPVGGPSPMAYDYFMDIGGTNGFQDFGDEWQPVTTTVFNDTLTDYDPAITSYGAIEFAPNRQADQQEFSVDLMKIGAPGDSQKTMKFANGYFYFLNDDASRATINANIVSAQIQSTNISATTFSGGQFSGNYLLSGAVNKVVVTNSSGIMQGTGVDLRHYTGSVGTVLSIGGGKTSFTTGDDTSRLWLNLATSSSVTAMFTNTVTGNTYLSGTLMGIDVNGGFFISNRYATNPVINLQNRVNFTAGSTTITPFVTPSGALNTTPVVGAHEFLTDKFYGVITTGAARKEFTLNDAALTSGRVPFTTTNGRLLDDSAFLWNNSTKLLDIAGNINLSDTTSSIGQFKIGGLTVFHTYGNPSQNLFIGSPSGNYTLTKASAIENVGLGANTLVSLTTGDRNLAIGAYALYNITNGNNNVAVGDAAMYGTVAGVANNTAIGSQAGRNSAGSNNTYIGLSAGYYGGGGTGGGSGNTGMGCGTVSNATTGSYNFTGGFYSGYNITSGSYNIIMGAAVDAPSASASGQLNIGNVLYGTGLYQTNTQSSTPTAAGKIGIGIAPTQRLTLAAGTASAGTAPLAFTSGTNLTTAVAGVMEYNGTNLFFTRTGSTRENVVVAVDNAVAPTTSIGVGIVNYYGASATNFLGDPNRWISVNILGSVYKIPLYT